MSRQAGGLASRHDRPEELAELSDGKEFGAIIDDESQDTPMRMRAVRRARGDIRGDAGGTDGGG